MKKTIISNNKTQNVVHEYEDGYKWIFTKENERGQEFTVLRLFKRRSFVEIRIDSNNEIATILPYHAGTLKHYHFEKYVSLTFRKYVTDFLNKKYLKFILEDEYTLDISGYVKKGEEYFDIFDLPKNFVYDGDISIVDVGNGNNPGVDKIQLPENLIVNNLSIFSSKLRLPKGLKVIETLHIEDSNIAIPKDAVIGKIEQ